MSELAGAGLKKSDVSFQTSLPDNELIVMIIKRQFPRCLPSALRSYIVLQYKQNDKKIVKLFWRACNFLNFIFTR